MNFLGTVNIGNYIEPIVLSRFRNACERWQCQYFEWTNPIPGTWEGCARFRIPEQIGEGHSVLLLDGDMLISKDCPNPFDFCVEDDAIYVVDTWRGFVVNDPGYRSGAYTLPFETVSKIIPDKNLKWPPIEKFFNSGFSMCRITQKVLSLFREMADVPIKPNWSPDDQAMFNLILFNSKDIQTIWMPNAWNFFYDANPESIKQQFIVHFGGPIYHQLLKTFKD